MRLTHVVQMRELDLHRRGQETGIRLHDNGNHFRVQKSGVAKEMERTQSCFLSIKKNKEIERERKKREKRD